MKSHNKVNREHFTFYFYAGIPLEFITTKHGHEHLYLYVSN